MQEKTLLKIGLFGSLIGLIVLYFFSTSIELTQIEKINAEQIDETVKITGKVISVHNYDKVAFVKMAKDDYIDVVIFKDKDINLSEGDDIAVEGSVEEYNNRLQVVASLVER